MDNNTLQVWLTLIAAVGAVASAVISKMDHSKTGQVERLVNGQKAAMLTEIATLKQEVIDLKGKIFGDVKKKPPGTDAVSAPT